MTWEMNAPDFFKKSFQHTFKFFALLTHLDEKQQLNDKALLRKSKHYSR